MAMVRPFLFAAVLAGLGLAGGCGGPTMRSISAAP